MRCHSIKSPADINKYTTFIRTWVSSKSLSLQINCIWFSHNNYDIPKLYYIYIYSHPQSHINILPPLKVADIQWDFCTNMWVSYSLQISLELNAYNNWRRKHKIIGYVHLTPTLLLLLNHNISWGIATLIIFHKYPLYLFLKFHLSSWNKAVEHSAFTSIYFFSFIQIRVTKAYLCLIPY